MNIALLKSFLPMLRRSVAGPSLEHRVEITNQEGS